jgi:hypothetical protein
VRYGVYQSVARVRYARARGRFVRRRDPRRQGTTLSRAYPAFSFARDSPVYSRVKANTERNLCPLKRLGECLIYSLCSPIDTEALRPHLVTTLVTS